MARKAAVVQPGQFGAAQQAHVVAEGRCARGHELVQHSVFGSIAGEQQRAFGAHGQASRVSPAEIQFAAFAREHQLTAAEQQVLQSLCAGLQPQEIAQRHGVAISTVRTQIASVRAKTATESIRDLVAMVAQLPPMQGVLRVVELR